MKKPFKLLIIDDAEEILSALTNFFSQKKYTVVSAANGLDGLKHIEAKDADAEILALNEVNAGVYAFRRASLEQALASLKPDNAQGEYYLTDVVGWLTRRSLPVAAAVLDDPEEMQGVNTREDLGRVERVLAQRKLFLREP